MNILIYRDISEPELAALSGEFPQCAFRCTSSSAALQDDLEWPEVIFGNAPASVLPGCTRLRWLQIVSAGFDEYMSLSETNILVTTAHGIRAPIIAQHVLMSILIFVRQQLHFAACQRKALWDRRPDIPQQLEGQTVGLIGYGKVAQEVARLTRPLGMRLVATRRTVTRTPPELDDLYPLEKLDDMLRESDHLVLALPYNSETKGILDRRRIGLLKWGGVVHNVARGGLLDEEALIERLRDGTLGGAALDVFDREPLPADSPFWTMSNVMVTPHLAGHHAGASLLVLEQFKTNLRNYVDHRALEHVANFARGY